MIRWITPRLGTGSYDEIGEGPWLLLDVRHLVDKAGNPSQALLDVIRKGVDALRKGRTVVVACDFGISRSNALAAGILSLCENRPFDQALREVIRTTGESEIKFELVASIQAALGSKTQGLDRRRILVTGASGFIGRHLIAQLSNATEVLRPSRSELDLEKGAIELADYCACEEVGQIVHLAYPRMYTNASSLGSSLVMLRSVLDVCRILNIRLIFVSSWVVFNDETGVAHVIDENAPLRPKGIYAETKYLEEKLVDLYFRRGEIRRVVCRFSPVYGPGGHRPRLIHKFFHSARRGETIITHRFRNGRPALDLLYVTDAVDALSRAVATDQSDIFHFGSGVLRSTAEIAALICRIAGRRVPLDEISIEDDIHNIAFPAQKARQLLDWVPEIDIETGLTRTLLSESK